MGIRNPKPEATRQEYIFLKAVTGIKEAHSSQAIQGRMRAIAEADFGNVSVADSPRRLIRLIDEAEESGVLRAVALDSWVSTERAEWHRDSLNRVLTSLEL